LQRQHAAPHHVDHGQLPAVCVCVCVVDGCPFTSPSPSPSPSPQVFQMNGLERDELIYVVPLYDIVCQVMEVCVCVCDFFFLV